MSAAQTILLQAAQDELKAALKKIFGLEGDVDAALEVAEIAKEERDAARRELEVATKDWSRGEEPEPTPNALPPPEEQ